MTGELTIETRSPTQDLDFLYCSWTQMLGFRSTLLSRKQLDRTIFLGGEIISLTLMQSDLQTEIKNK